MLVCADGAPSRLAMKLGLVSQPPNGSCSTAYVEGGTHKFTADGVIFYHKDMLPGELGFSLRSPDPRKEERERERREEEGEGEKRGEEGEGEKERGEGEGEKGMEGNSSWIKVPKLYAHAGSNSKECTHKPQGGLCTIPLSLLQATQLCSDTPTTNSTTVSTSSRGTQRSRTLTSRTGTTN